MLQHQNKKLSYCSYCKNNSFVLFPKGKKTLAKKCSYCSKTCTKCNNTGFIFSRDRFEREIVTRCICSNLNESIALYNQANIPERYYDASLENFEVDQKKLHNILNIAKFTVKNYPEKKEGILLYGNAGSGKTRLACAMLLEFIFRYQVSAKFIEFTNLLSEIKYGYDMGKSESELLESILKIDVLVIDELGKGRKSEWEMNILDSLIASRYNSHKMTILTTNYTEKESTTYQENFRYRTSSNEWKETSVKETLKMRLQNRVYSRLKEMCSFIDMDLNDFRLKNTDTSEVVC